MRKVFYLDPAQTISDDQILDSLIDISKKIARKPILMIIADEFAKFAARHKDILSKFFILPRLDSNIVEGLCDKKNTHFMAMKRGLAYSKNGIS